jgi:arylsulfatase A-like enzyme
VLGAKYPEDRTYDGINLIEKATKNEKAHDALYWRSDYNKAIRKDHWKLLVNEADNQILLYDLENDISEKNNIAAQNKVLVDSLSAQIQQWEVDMIKPLWPRAVNYVYKDGNEKTRFGF